MQLLGTDGNYLSHGNTDTAKTDNRIRKFAGKEKLPKFWRYRLTDLRTKSETKQNKNRKINKARKEMFGSTVTFHRL